MTLARTDTPRRPVAISTRAISDDLSVVSTPDQTIGYIRSQWNGYAALRGVHLASAQLVGTYATRGLALEALRQRPRSI